MIIYFTNFSYSASTQPVIGSLPPQPISMALQLLRG